MVTKYTYKVVPKRENRIGADVPKPVTVSFLSGAPLAGDEQHVTAKLADLIGQDAVDNAQTIRCIAVEELPMYTIPRVQ